MTKKNIAKLSDRQINDMLSCSQVVPIDVKIVQALKAELKKRNEHHCSPGSPCAEHDHNILESVYGA